MKANGYNMGRLAFQNSQLCKSLYILLNVLSSNLLLYVK